MAWRWIAMVQKVDYAWHGKKKFLSQFIFFQEDTLMHMLLTRIMNNSGDLRGFIALLMHRKERNHGIY
ncbi:hypothetical protein EPI10_022833 [Gossypium australe]|uniref:Uncharacterized protein n=1 Tax=Gossypium australe TaxID=47621 RepID=A0A5B6VSX9_9ROSI|nr:hypothetical protein EPI10_022833 [Gossypium australe]